MMPSNDRFMTKHYLVGKYVMILKGNFFKK